MPSTKSILLFISLLFLNSCSVHTFTYGDGPKENFKKTVKQNNYVGGFISEGTPKLEELNDLKVRARDLEKGNKMKEKEIHNLS